MDRRAEPHVWKRGRGRDSIRLRIIAFAGWSRPSPLMHGLISGLCKRSFLTTLRRLSPCPLLRAEYTVSPGTRRALASQRTSLYQARKAGNFRFYSGQFLLCDKDKDVGV